MNLQVCVLLANGFGDHLLAVPTLRALRQIFTVRLILITAVGPSECFFSNLGFDQILAVPMLRRGTSAARDFDAIELSRKLGPIDCFISLVPWQSHSLTSLIQAIGPQCSVGFGSEYDVRITPPTNLHVVDQVFAIAQRFDPSVCVGEFSQELSLPEDALAGAAAVSEAIGRSRRMVSVHVETTTASKRWPSTCVAEAITELSGKVPEVFFLVLSAEPGDPALNVCEDTLTSISGASLEFFTALIARSDLFIGVDSVGLHVADLWRVPSLGLFGSTDPATWGFRFTRSYTHLNGLGDMTNIKVDDVVSSALELLKEIDVNAGNRRLERFPA